MIKESNYHANWQKSRIDFILSLYPKDFFVGKKILELAPYNGYIGAYFYNLGADVYCLEGRTENINSILKDYPFLKVEEANLDTNDWKWGSYDIIINFGLYYHLEKYHIEHLENCLKNCKLMFFETLVYDSFESEIFFRDESNNKLYKDQSLSNIGGTPTTKFVESIFKKNLVEFKKFNSSLLNADLHHYDWIDKNLKVFDIFARRFWIINT